MEITDRHIAVVLAFAIGFTLFGIFSQSNPLTGFAVAGGTATFNVDSESAITLPVANVSFGSGYVSSNASNCTIYITEGSTVTTVGCTGFSSSIPAGSLSVRNDGNTQLYVSIYSTQTAQTLFGSGGKFQFIAFEKEAGSCTGTLTSTWSDIGTTPQAVCTNLSYIDENDNVGIGIKLVIPSSAHGSKTMTLSIDATEIYEK